MGQAVGQRRLHGVAVAARGDPVAGIEAIEMREVAVSRVRALQPAMPFHQPAFGIHAGQG